MQNRELHHIHRVYWEDLCISEYLYISRVRICKKIHWIPCKMRHFWVNSLYLMIFPRCCKCFLFLAHQIWCRDGMSSRIPAWLILLHNNPPDLLYDLDAESRKREVTIGHTEIQAPLGSRQSTNYQVSMRFVCDPTVFTRLFNILYAKIGQLTWWMNKVYESSMISN